MKASIIPLAVAGAVICGCATPIQYIKPAPQSGQKLVHAPANAAIKGVQQITDNVHVEVLFEPTAGNAMFNGMAVFWVFVKNKGAAPIGFSAADITAEDQNGKKVELVTLDKIAQKMRTNKSSQEFVFILASSFLSALEAAPYSRVQQTGIYSGYTSRGEYVSGVASTSGPNTTVQYLAQQQNSARVGQFSGEMEGAYARALSNVQRLSLTAAELAPGATTEGIIALPLPTGFSLPNKFRVKVSAGKDHSTHDFAIARSSQ